MVLTTKSCQACVCWHRSWRRQKKPNKVIDPQFLPQRNIIFKVNKRHVVQAIEEEATNKNSSYSNRNVYDKILGLVVIVGGGPEGLAVALTLAERGCKDITVLDSQSWDDLYDLGTSYMHGINSRGQKLFRNLNLYDKLLDCSVSSYKQMTFRVNANGKQIKVPQRAYPEDFPPTFFLSKSDVLNMLFKKVEEHKDAIKYHFSSKSIEISKSETDLMVTYLENQSGQQIVINPQLIIGADGKSSLVRERLNQWNFNRKFNIISETISSSGRAYKIFLFPANFPIDKNNKNTSQSNCLYIFTSKNQNQKQKSVLISNPPSQALIEKNQRIAPIFAEQDHPIFQFDKGEKILDYLEKEFPQIPIRKILSVEEADKFAKRKLVVFPPLQYCENISYNISNTNKGVILIGDAIHIFPPDIQQGINAGLEDIDLFNKLLDKNQSDLILTLQEYENMRITDMQALMEFLKIPSEIMLPMTNLKLYLNKKVPWLFPYPALVYLLDANLRYSEVIVRTEQANFQYTYVLGILMVISIIIAQLFT